jgi:hypothetical protein
MKKFLIKPALHWGFSLLLIALSARAHAAGRVVGQVGMIEGTVLVDEVQVKKPAPVREGSVVEVKKGKATLVIGKGNVFHLSADSKMVVSQFGAKAVGEPGSGSSGVEEKGELDLKFGRTRALIMNLSNDKKELKIRARAATMGVRGTEIYIDAPKDSNRPINFFTLEGRADVRSNDLAPPVPVNQNQGVSTSGVSAGTGPSGGASGAGPSGNMAPPTLSVAEVKSDIQGQGMDSKPIQTPQDMRRQVTQQYISDQFGMGALPPLVLDPLQDRFAPVRVLPRFCNATSGVCP